MEEHNANQARLLHYGHFGLSDSVSAAVVDYYELLFDNVQEFISHNKEELKDYEQENSELAVKLAAGGLDQSGEQEIRTAMRTNVERIGEIQDFLNSDRACKAGIDFSEDILDDAEPELTERFTAAPITEKYACLVKRYMEDYRTDLETRVDLSHKGYIEASAEVDSHRRDQPSVLDALTSFGSAGRQWVERLGALEHTAAGKWKDWQDLQAYAGTDSLVDIDSFRFGVKKTQELFPKIAEQYSEHKRAEYKELLEADPVRLHSDLIMEYSTEHVADMGEKLLGLQHDRDARQLQLREHDASKPGWLKNAATLGNAEKTWRTEREALSREIAGIKEQMAEVQKNREECRDGWLSETVRSEAKQMLLSRHPDVVKACEQHMARHWKEANEARLERQRARLAERESGKEPDNGLAR